MCDSAVRLTRTRSVPSFIAGSLLTLTFMSLVPASLTGAQGGKTDLIPVQKSSTYSSEYASGFFEPCAAHLPASPSPRING